MMTHDDIPRHIEERINSAMTHMKIVSITGAHGSGKTTLAQKIAKERGMKFVSLDDPNTCEQALRDPNGFTIEATPKGRLLRSFQDYQK